MIREKDYFQSSINIRFDFGRQALYERYLPTSSHVDSLKGLLKGFLGEGNRAHIIVGSYGSGKSLLGMILAGIVSKSIDDIIIDQLSNKFQTVDDKIHELLLHVKKTNITYIPVFLSSEEGSFKRSLLSALYNTLREQNLDFTHQIIVADILNIVDTWKKKYKTTYDEFLALLEKKTWTIDTWRKDIEKINVKAIEWFKKTYPILTSGSKLSLSFDKDLTSQLEYISDQLRARNLGLFIVYDEFGRFLQTLPSTEVNEAMQELQDLAEFSNSDKGNNLNVLLITHRNLGQYALRYNEELQKEFQRIEKRYNIYYTKSDPSTFIRLSSLVTKDYRDNYIPADEFVKELRYFNLFPDLNIFEIDSIVIKESYPLHPVSLFILPPLANLVAQNERTLFTFLESDERGGLGAYFELYRDWYRIDSVFDYFEPSFGEFESDSLIGQAYTMYQRLQKRLTESLTHQDELKVIKLLTIWNIAGLYAQQDPNEDFISFALSWTSPHTKRILEQLQAKKAIRYNNALDHWELFEGSSIDLEAEINVRLQTYPLNRRQKMNLLKSVLSNKYVLPKQYNDNKSITRFAPIVPLYLSELKDKEAILSIVSVLKEVDIAMFYVFNDTYYDEFLAKKDLVDRSIKDKKAIFVFPNEIIPIDHYLEQLAMLYLMRDDKYFISQERYLLGELEAIITQIIYKINQTLAPITKFHNCSWIYNGEEYPISSSMFLSKFLSYQVMDIVYSHTPEVKNETFNRKTITSVQKKAAVQVVDQIIQFHKTNVIDIKGYGPEYLIFATVIKNNQIDLNNPNITDRENLQQLRGELQGIINRGSGKISEVIETFLNPPYGIRKPVIPILLVALLHYEWNYLMLYHNGMFNKRVDGELLYHMIDNPEQYTFKYLPFDAKYIAFIQGVKAIFCDFIEEEDQYLHPAVFVNQVLLRWLRSLPRITQNTKQTVDLANQIKQSIREGEVQPDISLERLYSLCEDGEKIEFLKDVKSECEEYNEKHKRSIRDSILQKANATSFLDLQVWAHDKNTIVRASNPFVKAIFSSNEPNWIDELCEKIVGVKRVNWSDTTDQLFISQISSNLEHLTDETSHESYIEIKIGDAMFAIPKVNLSEKSQAVLISTRANLIQMTRKIPKAELQIMLLELLKEFTND